MNEVLDEILEELRKLNFQNKKVFTQEEAAEYLNTHQHKIGELRQAGILMPVKLGASYIYYVEDLDRFIRNYQGCDLSNKKAMMIASQKNMDRHTPALDDLVKRKAVSQRRSA